MSASPAKRPTTAAERQEQLRSILSITIPLTVLAAVIAGVVMVLFPDLGNIKYLSVHDGAALREVFFSGQPWVVVCSAKDGSVLRVVAEASGELRKSQIHTAAIDCEDRLPDSGKTIYERFGFKRSPSAPLVMLTGNGQPVRQIDAEKLESVSAFVSHVAHQSQLRVFQPTTDAELQQACFSRKACVIITTRGKLQEKETNALRLTMTKNRNLTFVVLDVRKRQLKFPGHTPHVADAGPSMYHFKRESSAAAKSGDTQVSWALHEHTGPFTSTAMLDFLRSKIYTAPVRLASAPHLPGRSAEGKPASQAEDEDKARAADRAARKARRDMERDQQRQEREQKTAARPGGGSSEEEAERERERERQRRRDMDEEAAQWFDDSSVDGDEGGGEHAGEEVEEEIEEISV